MSFYQVVVTLSEHHQPVHNLINELHPQAFNSHINNSFEGINDQFINIENHNESYCKKSKNTTDNLEGPLIGTLDIMEGRVGVYAKVGGQRMFLSFDSMIEGIRLFDRNSQHACHPMVRSIRSLRSIRVPLIFASWKSMRNRLRDSNSSTSDNLDNKNRYSGSSIIKDENKLHDCYDPYLSSTASWCKNNFYDLCELLKPSERPECNASKTLDLSYATIHSRFKADGMMRKELIIEGFDHVELNISSLMNETIVNIRREVPVSLVENNFFPKYWASFKYADGLLGIAGSEISCRQYSVWNQLLKQKNVTVFALDINVEANEQPTASNYWKKNGYQHDKNQFGTTKSFFDRMNWAELHLGGFSDAYGPIHWAEPTQYGDIYATALFQFTMYDLSVCGSPIFTDSSSNWEAVIDLSSSCLVLPYDSWERLMNWIPLKKNVESCPFDNTLLNAEHPPMCSPDNNPTLRPLPAISFKLRENSNSMNNNGHTSSSTLVIPLESLVYYDSYLEQQMLCIIPEKPSHSKHISYRTYNPRIRFGTMVLKSLYAVIDRGRRKIGLAQKASSSSNDKSCNQKISCRGEQHYNQALNRCEDPVCSLWIFKTLNENTKKCEISNYVSTVIWCLVLLFMLLDLQSHFLYRKVVSLARRRCT